jgi:predicted amidohydrolase YtcJ
MRTLYKPLHGAYDSEKRNLKEFVVENGVFSFNFQGKVDEVKELNGYVYPGFIDSHAHLVGTGKKVLVPSLDEVESMEELLYLARTNEYKVLRGWNEEKLGRYPTKEELDSVSHPVIVVRRCGHVGVANTLFMKITGVQTEDGVLRENVLTAALNSLKEDENETIKALKAGEKEFFKYGVTSVHSDDMYSIAFENVQKALRRAKIDVYEHYHIHSLKELEEFIKMGKPLPSIKILLDGSLGAHTAYLREPYADAPSRGVLNFEEEEFLKIIKMSNENDIQTCVHVIGDGALDIALKAFEDTDSSLRHRLIHVQVCHDDQIEKIKEEKLLLDVQPQFFVSDEKMVVKRLSDRVQYSYRFKEMIERGIPTAFSSDSPVEIPNPLEGIKAARKMGISSDNALTSYTTQGAYQEFAENKKGRFKEGMKADFVVLSKPISDEETKVLATYKNGQLVFSNETF